MAELCHRRDEVTDADLVELRLDTVSDPDAAGALAGRRRPVIVTCRPEWEGGHFKGSEEERKRILANALTLGAEYVDIESRAGFDDLVSHSGGRRVVLSYHDFSGMPSDLPGLVQAMRSTGAAVVKIAVKTGRLSDCVSLLNLRVPADGERGVVLVGMGPFGLATRVLAGRFGSMWTYAGSDREVGQVSAAALLQDYRFRALTDATEIYGLVGLPVAHSVSPAMHNAAFAATGLDAVYLPFPAVSADDFMTFGRALGVKGVSVTIPHKVSLSERVDEVDAVRPPRRGHQQHSRNRRTVGRRQHRCRRIPAPARRTPAVAGDARVHSRERGRRAGGRRGLDVERLPRARARPQPRTRRRGGSGDIGRGRPHFRPIVAAGTCWSTAPRSGCIRTSTKRRSTPAT